MGCRSISCGSPCTVGSPAAACSANLGTLGTTAAGQPAHCQHTLHAASQPAHCSGAVLPHVADSQVAALAGAGSEGGGGGAGVSTAAGGVSGGGETGAGVVAGGGCAPPPLTEEPPRHRPCTCCLRWWRSAADVQGKRHAAVMRELRAGTGQACLPSTQPTSAHECLEHRVCQGDHLGIAALHVLQPGGCNGRLALGGAGWEVLG